MSEPPIPAPDAALAAEPMSEFDRLLGVLFDPQPAFADVAARPVRWWVPLLLLTVLAMAVTHFYTQRVGWERFFRHQMETNPRAAERIPADRREEVIRQQAEITSKFAYFSTLLAWPVITLVVAGVFLFVFNILLGSELTFRNVYAATCYAQLPHLLGGLVALALLFVKDPADYDLENPVASNIGAFLNPNSFPRWALTLGSAIDVFSIWVLVLLATGFAAAGRRLPWKKSFTWVTATWVFYVAAKTTWVWIWS